MKREHIVLRTPTINSDITKPRLLDSNGKRKSNNKIAIFSNKYNLMSAHSLPEGTQEMNSQMTPLIKTNSEYTSTTLCDSSSQRLSYESKPVTEYQTQFTPMRQENLLNMIREEIGNVKNRYQVKMRELVQSNARTICELRQMLTQQQRRLVQKQIAIQKLIAEKHLTNTNNRISQTKIGQKLSQSQFRYLKSRIHDIEVKVNVLLQALANRDSQNNSKLQDLQQKLIRNAGSKLVKCKQGLQFVVCEMSKKMQTFEQRMLNVFTMPKPVRNQNINIDSFKTSIKQMQKKVNDFCNQQWKYECPEIAKLMTILEDLTSKIRQNQHQTNHLHKNYYYEDQDQFFYPSTQRVYEASDDYEHFQQDSEDEGFKKQNRPPNYKLGCK